MKSSKSSRDFFDDITKKTHAFYSSEIKEGYVWKTNCSEEEIKQRVSAYQSEGLEVFVGSVAFNANGEIVNENSAILTRKSYLMKNH